MKIIDYITEEKINLSTNMSKIQNFCASKLRENPLPKSKNETWRISNKQKLSSLLEYQYDLNSYQPNIPSYLTSKKAIEINVGNANQFNLKENDWQIKELNTKEINFLIEEKIINNNSEPTWTNLLNHSLVSEENLLGIKISGENIPPLQIFCNSKNNHFNAKTLILLIDEKTTVDLLQVNLGDKNSSLSLTTYVWLEKEASLNHGVISLGNGTSNLLNSLDVIQKIGSNYKLSTIQMQYDFARFEVNINQSEGGGHTTIRGMQVSNDNEQIGTYTKVVFNGPKGYLDQLNKSLANDKSHSIFDGSIIVPKNAQKTDAAQLSRNLLLSNTAKIDTKPQLEIIADDVKCKHGATITQLNEDELFYMRSRGLTFAEASKLQLKSYYKEIIDSIPVLEEGLELLNHLLN